MIYEFMPSQSYNGYETPWGPGLGSNKWDEEWEVGTFNTTTGANTINSESIRAKNIIECLPSTQYRFVSSNTAWFIFFDSNGDVIPTPTVPGSSGTNNNSKAINRTFSNRCRINHCFKK